MEKYSCRKEINMDNEYKMEIHHQALLLHLIKNAKIIVIAVMAGFLVTYFILPPKYEVSTRMYVLNRGVENVISYADYKVSNQIIEECKILITGQNVAKEVL